MTWVESMSKIGEDVARKEKKSEEVAAFRRV